MLMSSTSIIILRKKYMLDNEDIVYGNYHVAMTFPFTVNEDIA